MKRYILLLVGLLSCSFVYGASANKKAAKASTIESSAKGSTVESSAKGVVATLKSYEYREDSVYLSLNLNLEDIDISSKESIFLTPMVYKSVEKVEYLPTVVIRGRNSSKSYNRTVVLKNRNKQEEYKDLYKTPYEVIDYYGEGRSEIKEMGGEYSYNFVLPYQTWMVESEVMVMCESYGCCSLDNNGIMQPSDNNPLTIEMLSVEPFCVTPKVSLIKPEKVAIKRRDIKYSSSLIFRVNSWHIDPALANNREELRSIDEMMESVVSDKDYTITAVNIIGYASPEGTLATNQRLSENRAKALEKILKEKYNLSHSLYNVNFGGENWDALIPIVEKSDMPDKEKVLDIIKNVDLLNGREVKLMTLNDGVPYRYMLKNFFPSVRLVVVDVEYNVDAYDIVRIKEVINEKPQNLSLEEMYRLSETYDVDSEEFVNIFLTAVNEYPNDEVALNNALVVDINKGNIESASKLADRVKEESASAQTLNTLGAYYLLKGDYDKSKELLTIALSKGCKDAQFNLDQLNKKLVNIVQLEESKALRTKIYGE